MTSNPNFREIPPWTTVLEVLTLLKLPTEIPGTFQKTDISLEQVGAAVSLLEPYYVPCKAKQFLEFTDETRIVTILRHILLPHGYIILSHETTRNKKKAIFYTMDRISVIEGPLRTAVKVDFS
jgi:hypothetical protein